MIIQDPVIAIILELQKYKETKEDIELMNDIMKINNMVNHNICIYDMVVANQIYDKYEAELKYLQNLERSFHRSQITANNQTMNSNTQWLLNLRHALVRVQILRIVKRKGKEIAENDLINHDNNFLYNKFIETMR